MNFGKWIVVAFVLFAGFIATLVTVCVRQDIPLVTKEYYQEELAYQDQITRIENVNDLTRKPEISASNGTVSVSYESLPSISKGELRIFRPSDSALDETFPLEGSGTTVQDFTLKHPVPGLYRARMKWEQDGKEYFVEKLIVM